MAYNWTEGLLHKIYTSKLFLAVLCGNRPTFPNLLQINSSHTKFRYPKKYTDLPFIAQCYDFREPPKLHTHQCSLKLQQKCIPEIGELEKY